jgi:hypothetical protein
LIADQNNIRILKFGTNDIAIIHSCNTVYFAENNQYFDVPAVYDQAALDLMTNHTKVILTFKSTDAIDIIIEALNNAKQYLQQTEK